jgi:hypothetical protein
MKLRKNVALGDTGFIFNANTGESFTVNPIGLEIFNLIRKDMSIAGIRKEVFKKYNVEESMLSKDIDDFIHQLDHYQMLENNEQA